MAGDEGTLAFNKDEKGREKKKTRSKTKRAHNNSNRIPILPNWNSKLNPKTKTKKGKKSYLRDPADQTLMLKASYQAFPDTKKSQNTTNKKNSKTLTDRTRTLSKTHPSQPLTLRRFLRCLNSTLSLTTPPPSPISSPGIKPTQYPSPTNRGGGFKQSPKIKLLPPILKHVNPQI